jgi:hypothetical protein
MAMNWLHSRNYLPVEEADFAIHQVDVTCGNWTAAWYGIKPLQKSTADS